MSLSNPGADSVNPTKKYFKWAGQTGKVQWYDKESKQDIDVQLPFMFRVLDQLSTIVGYMEGKGGFWSNEVRSTQTDLLHVRSKGGVEFSGLYSDLNVKGAKYATSVYFAYKDGKDQYVIGNIKLSGAALSSWIDFNKKHNMNQIAVALTGSEHGKKGSVEFEKPVFEAVEVSDESTAVAIELDKILQDYLKDSATRAPKPTQAVQTQIDTQTAEDDSQPADEPQAVQAAPQAPAGDLDLSKVKF